MDMYFCVCVFASVRGCKYFYAHACARVFLLVRIFVCLPVCSCVCVGVHVFVYIFLSMWVFVRKCAYVFACVCACIFTYLCAHLDLLVYLYVCTLVSIYSCVCACVRLSVSMRMFVYKCVHVFASAYSLTPKSFLPFTFLPFYDPIQQLNNRSPQWRITYAVQFFFFSFFLFISYNIFIYIYHVFDKRRRSSSFISFPFFFLN